MHVTVVLRTTLRTTSGPNATRRKLNSHEYGTNQTPISKGVIRLSLLARLLPLDLTAKSDSVVSFKMVAAPEGLFLPAEKIRELAGLPPLIEPEPPLVIEPAEPETATEPEAEPEPISNVRVFTPSGKERS